jgi:hypothetical protein
MPLVRIEPIEKRVQALKLWDPCPGPLPWARMAVRPLDLNKRNPATIVPFDAMAVERCGGGQFHLYERSFCSSREGRRLDSGLFLCERGPGTTVALVVLGRWARLDFLPPSPRARLPCPASESPLVRGFFVCKTSHRLRLCELCEPDSPGTVPTDFLVELRGTDGHRGRGEISSYSSLISQHAQTVRGPPSRSRSTPSPR